MKMMTTKKNCLLVSLIVTMGFITLSCEQQSIKSQVQDQGKAQAFWEKVSQSKDHWDYLAFLNLYPESEHFDTSLARFFSFQNQYFDEHGVPPWHPRNNGFTISLLKGDSLLGNAELFSRDSIEHIAYNFLVKSGSSRDFPDLMPFMDVRYQEREISKGVFLVWVDSIDRIQPLVVELKNAWDKYKSHLSRTWYDDISIKDSTILHEKLDSAFIRRIYFYEGKRLIPPPPPPADE